MEASFSVLPLLWPLSEVKVTQLCPILCHPIDYTVHGLLQVRILAWVAFPSPGDLSNPGIESRSTTLQVDSLSAEPQGKPQGSIHRTLEWVAYPFSRGSSQPRNKTRVSCIAGGFITNWAIREALKWMNKYNPSTWWRQDRRSLFWNLLQKTDPCSSQGFVLSQVWGYGLCRWDLCLSCLFLLWNSIVVVVSHTFFYYIFVFR